MMELETGVQLALHPDHRSDLLASGLTGEMILAAGIRALAPAEWARYLGSGVRAKIQSAYLIPYPATSDFYRVKLFPPVLDDNGHHVRYYQPPGTEPRLYFPPRARLTFADPTTPLLITEGEKKALKADQEGRVCIAVGGLWNWLHDGRAIPDLDRVDWCERPTILVPDSDVWTRPDLLNAVYALAKELEARGAVPTVRKLPAGADGLKVGLDDYLCRHTSGDLDGLPDLPLKHPVFSRSTEWWKGWRARRDHARATTPPALALLERGTPVQLLHPAQDVVEKVLFYGVHTDDQLLIITSGRKVFPADQLPLGLKLRRTDLDATSVSRDVALRWLSQGAMGSCAQALDGLRPFFQRYLVLRDSRMALVLAAWALGTWCHRAFRIFPYLSVRSTDKQCGKSRLLTLIGKVSFNASPVTTHPTEAQLYRAAARTAGTQLLDEMDHLRGDKERFDTLISVLNVGFERGGVVTRLEKRGEQYVEVPYEVYAPRVLAGLAGLKDTLEDRSLPIFMLRKRRDEPVARLTAAVDPDAEQLRATCALACLTRIEDILMAYEHAPALLEREAVDDRAVDLWAPLLAPALVADAEDRGTRTRELLDAVRDLSTLRDADAEAGLTFRLVEALEGISRMKGHILKPTELLKAIQELPGFSWIKSTKRLANLLNPLGFVAGSKRQGGSTIRAYELDPDRLADLRTRYAPSSPAPEEAQA